ncbi:MAG: hypothetical protein JWM87_871 [Candidatus Eremiobacteraeota bacterium]|nr:hypothetical protein [Candidatus Eremiobacteraeota bacterium]
MGLLAAVLLDAAAGFGRASVHAAADHAIEAAMHDAVADYQNRLQDALAHELPRSSGAIPANASTTYAYAIASLPNPLQRSYVSGASAASGASGAVTSANEAASARFTLAYAVAPTTIAAPVCPRFGPAESNGPDAVVWLQCNGLVGESRMSLRVTVRVLDANGAAMLAQREQYVTLRLFAAPPYSAVVGRKDGAAADPAGYANGVPAHEGDLGGATIAGASPAPSALPPAGGTLIHVRYECVDGAGSCANAAPPDPDADLRQGATWTNGNVPTP